MTLPSLPPAARGLWAVVLLGLAAAAALIPSSAERTGAPVCLAGQATGEPAQVRVRGHLRGPVSRAGVRQRAVLLVDRPVEEWGDAPGDGAGGAGVRRRRLRPRGE